MPQLRTCPAPASHSLPVPPRATIGDEEDLQALSATSLQGRPPFLAVVALMAIMDPPREEVIEAVRVAHEAGITVKMITGQWSLGHAGAWQPVCHLGGVQPWMMSRQRAAPDTPD